MDIVPARRIIEVEPVSLPMPVEVPSAEPAPAEPAPAEPRPAER